MSPDHLNPFTSLSQLMAYMATHVHPFCMPSMLHAPALGHLSFKICQTGLHHSGAMRIMATLMPAG